MSRSSSMQQSIVGRDGVELRYEVIGPEQGPPIVVTPGGQNGLEHAPSRALAQRLAYQHGFRVLLHDRVNNGGSSIFLGRQRSKAQSEEELASAEYFGHGEPKMQAYFLRLLMVDLGMIPAMFWGQSSGARMSIFFATMFPSDVIALVLVNITGGPKAAMNLAHSYHGRHAEACRRGGMEAVMKQDLFAQLVARRPANAEVLRGMACEQFIAAELGWASFLSERDGSPIVGASAEILKSVQQPAFCVNSYGEKNDGMHTPAAIRALADGLGNCSTCLVETRNKVWEPQAISFLDSLIHSQASQPAQASLAFDGSSIVELDAFVFFWKPPAVFSQWTKSDFVVEGVQYDCCEMYMMAEKAKLFGDAERRRQILSSTGNPKQMKALGQRVQNFDQAVWDATCFEIVVAANLAKFDQNANMRQQLLATGDKVLVEASPLDRIWGIGLRADDPDCLDPSKWRGTNKLGEALMAVRRVLKNRAEASRDYEAGDRTNADVGPAESPVDQAATIDSEAAEWVMVGASASRRGEHMSAGAPRGRRKGGRVQGGGWAQ